MLEEEKTKIGKNPYLWVEEYKRIRPLYEEFCGRLKYLLEDFLDEAKIKYQIVEARAKSIESFKEKLNRAGKSYDNPLQQFTDLTGLRIIVYYVDDIDKVCEMLKREFEIDDLSSVDKRQVLEPDQLGYLSVHKVISLNEARRGLSEWKLFKDFKAEIQIRTILQHAWAAISHALQYKREEDIPKSLRRKLFRLSGLLELADEDFEDLRIKQESLERDIAKKIDANDLKFSINSLTLAEYISKSNEVQEIVNIALKSGFRLYETEELNSDLLSACLILDIKSIEELNEKIKDLKLFAESYFREFFKVHLQDRAMEVAGSASHILAVILIGAYSKGISLEDINKKLKWYEKYIMDVVNAGQVFKEK